MEHNLPYKIRKAIDESEFLYVCLVNELTQEKIFLESATGTARASTISKVAEERGFQHQSSQEFRDHIVHHYTSEYGSRGGSDLRLIQHKSGKNSYELAKPFKHEDESKNPDWVIHKGTSAAQLRNQIRGE